MFKHLLILIKSIVLTIILFMIFNVCYIAYLHFLLDWKGSFGYDINQIAITLDKKPVGFIWGEMKTYGLLGFIFVVIWIREYF